MSEPFRLESGRDAETLLTEEFLNTWTSHINIEDTHFDGDEINGVGMINNLILRSLNEYGTKTREQKIKIIETIFRFSEEKLSRLEQFNKSTAEYWCPHLDTTFIAEHDRLYKELENDYEEISTTQLRQDVVMDRRKFLLQRVLPLFAAGFLTGAGVEKTFKPVEWIINRINGMSGIEKAVMDLNRLTPEEQERLDEILIDNFENIKQLYTKLKPTVAEAFAEAKTRLAPKGLELSMFIDTPDKVFSEMIANKIWNHNTNEPLDSESFQANFGDQKPFYVPKDNHDVFYGSLYHPDYLQYYYENKAGFKLAEEGNPTLKETLVISLMFLSDNKNKRTPIADSALFCADYVYNRLAKK